MKKGVSLVSLAIAIIILSILAGIIVISSIESTNVASATMYATEMLNIKTNVEEYYLRYGQYPTINEITLDLSDIDYIDQFLEENIVSDTITFKAIDLALIGLSDLEYGNFEQPRDVYVLSETTGNVYYLLGIEYEGLIHYTLTDELYELAGVKPNKLVLENEIKKHDVILIPSDIEYTNKPITVQIKIPKEAQINSVTATDGKSVSEVTIANMYKVIDINKTTANKNGNYQIEINYTYKGATKTVNYKVSNFDNTSPTLNVEETVSNKIRTLNVRATDNQSGIKIIKYAENEIEDSAYFKNYGKTLLGTEIKLDQDKEYAIYVEDRAGNYQLWNSMLSGIVGTWDIDGVTGYQFNKDKTGSLLTPYRSYEFTYKIKGNNIELDFKNESTTDGTYAFELNGDKMFWMYLDTIWELTRVE